MLRLTPKGADLWDSLLPEAARALPEELAQVDALLQDQRFMEPFVRRFDERTGRPGLPVATYLRLMYLRRKHRLSYEALAGAVRDSIPWRTFCGIGCQDRIPSPSNLAGLTQKYGEESLAELYRTVDDGLEEWRIRPRRPSGQAAPRRQSALRRTLGRLPVIGPAMGRLVEKTARVVADEAQALSGDPSASRLRSVHRRLLRILQSAAAAARRAASGIKDLRARRQVQLALDLKSPDQPKP
ncbi:MAG: transposase [Elusimicrobia bacterium]|nr:transposase [Elusimicrobiota bacterium]